MKLVRDMRLPARLACGFGIVLALLAGLSVVSLLSIAELADGARTIARVNALKSQHAHAMETALNDAVIGMRNLAITEDGAEEDREYRRMTAALQRYDRALQALERSFDEAGGALPEERARLQAVAEAATAGRAIVVQAEREIREKGGTPAQVAFVIRLQLRTEMARWSQLQDDWGARIREFTALEQRLNEATAQALEARSQRTTVVVLAGAVLALLAGVLAAWRISGGVVGPVRQAVAVAQRVTEGDLSRPVVSQRGDELGDLLRALEAMRQRLHGLASRVHDATGAVTHTAEDMATANHDLAARTEVATASLRGSNDAADRLLEMVNRAAATAVHASELALKASEVASRSGEAVSQVVRTMGEIDASSRQITDITGVIDGLAFQTNLLALNAAVEAARAGEQGRGFSVVAAEVRNLAQRSADAARQIKQLIGASVDKVKSGTRQVEVAGGTMHEVVDSVAQVSSLVSEIRAGVGTQAVAVDEIAQSVRQLDRTTRQNADLVEESAAAADSLRMQAQALTEVVAVFRLADAPAPAVQDDTAQRQPNEIAPRGEGQLDDMQAAVACR